MRGLYTQLVKLHAEKLFFIRMSRTDMLVRFCCQTSRCDALQCEEPNQRPLWFAFGQRSGWLAAACVLRTRAVMLPRGDTILRMCMLSAMCAIRLHTYSSRLLLRGVTLGLPAKIRVCLVGCMILA